MLRRCHSPIAAYLLLLLLAGCSSVAVDIRRARTRGSTASRGLSWFMTILFLVITVIMWILVGVRLLQAARHRSRA